MFLGCIRRNSTRLVATASRFKSTWRASAVVRNESPADASDSGVPKGKILRNDAEGFPDAEKYTTHVKLPDDFYDDKGQLKYDINDNRIKEVALKHLREGFSGMNVNLEYAEESTVTVDVDAPPYDDNGRMTDEAYEKTMALAKELYQAREPLRKQHEREMIAEDLGLTQSSKPTEFEDEEDDSKRQKPSRRGEVNDAWEEEDEKWVEEDESVDGVLPLDINYAGYWGIFTVDIKRTTKVTKGGKSFSYSALVVTGNGKGLGGFAIGKATETSKAVENAFRKARRRVLAVDLEPGGVLPHSVTAEYVSSKVIITPTPFFYSTAMEAVQAVFEAVGVRHAVAKTIGSRNKNNVVRATFKALLQCKSSQTQSKELGKPVKPIQYAVPYIEYLREMEEKKTQPEEQPLP
mmetsp:Transcript_24345/g.40013  ORF Transcript_24345/g.40013 Transcript_24345/m.40013 type:complete len:406 (-) Transcript_24345:801-2018(-)